MQVHEPRSLRAADWAGAPPLPHPTPPFPQVCEAQLQFAPRAPLPVFGGTKGPEIRKSITDIQDSFQAQISHLRKLKYNILDVKATKCVRAGP